RPERIFNPALTKLRGAAPRRLRGMRRLAVDLLIEDAVAPTNPGPAAPVEVPRRAEARGEVIEITVGEALGQTRVAGKQDALRRIGHDRGLLVGDPGRVAGALLIEGNERLVAQ